MICGARAADKESSELAAARRGAIRRSRRKNYRASPLVPLVRNVMSTASSSTTARAFNRRSNKSASTSEHKQTQNETVNTAITVASTTSSTSSPQETIIEISCPICGEADRTKLQNCSRCRIISYCTRDHQKLDFKDHKRLCIQISKAQDPREKQQLIEQLLAEAVARIPDQISGKSIGNEIIKKLIINKNHTESNGKTTTEKISSSKTKPSQNRVKDTGINLHKREKGDNIPPITDEGSSEDTILESRAELLNPFQDSKVNNNTIKPSTSTMPEAKLKVNGIKHYPEIQLSTENPQFLSDRSSKQEIDHICRNVIRDMDKFGVCVVNNFLGAEKGDAVLKEVLNIHDAGLFKDGQLVSNRAGINHTKTIRGDKIVWLDGKEKFCKNIGMLISKVDAIIMRANKMCNNGKLGQYTINGRTKAMVACYPGHGSHYVKHVDNPNRDGRCITAIYYLNKHWCSSTMGGLLRIFPEGWDQVANIDPDFDRILFFWSDRRNPHEVQPAFDTRYAITLWYFDAEERNEACRRYQRVQTSGYDDEKNKEEKKS